MEEKTIPTGWWMACDEEGPYEREKKICPNHFALVSAREKWNEQMFLLKRKCPAWTFKSIWTLTNHKSSRGTVAALLKVLKVRTEEVIKKTNCPHAERQKCSCQGVCVSERERENVCDYVCVLERERESGRKIFLGCCQCPLFRFWLMVFFGSDYNELLHLWRLHLKTHPNLWELSFQWEMRFECLSRKRLRLLLIN